MTKFSDLADGERFMFVTDRFAREPFGGIAYHVKTGPHTYIAHARDGEVVHEGRVGVGDNPVCRVQALAEHEP